MSEPHLWTNLWAWALQATVVLAFGLGLLHLLRTREPRLRLHLGHALLALVLLLPVLQPWRTSQDAATASAGLTVDTSAAAASGEGAPRWVPRLAAGLYLAGVALRALWLLTGIATLAHHRRRARPLLPGPRVEELRTRLAVPASLRLSPRVAGPMTFGLRRPTVLLPSAFSELSEASQTSVVCHELLHVRRRDWLFVLGEEAVRTLLWFHPLVWWVLDHVALAREQTIDRQVVTLTGRRRPYLEALWRFAHQETAKTLPAGSLPAPAFATRSHLAKRVMHLRKETVMKRPQLFATSSALAVLLALATIASSLTFPLTTAAGEDKGILTVEGDVRPPKKIDGQQPAYPEEGRKEKKQGAIVLRTVITEEGRVSDVEVVKVDKGLDESFTEAAVDAIRTWTFEPATLNGKTVAVYFNLTVNFRLE